MKNKLFERDGAHVLVDGQYGSTGKGVLAAWLALQAFNQGVDFHAVVSNAGPNSGHTFYHNGEKHVLKQLPTFAVATYLLTGHAPIVQLSAGAIINPEQLIAEARQYPGLTICVHPNAAVITEGDRTAECSGPVAAVAGTRSGTGAALARKVLRDPTAVVGGANLPPEFHNQPNISIADVHVDSFNYRTFVEVSQGFSLGLNQHFYPKVTSRECTAGQAIADAGIPPRHVSKTYMSIRTFPIRVGDVDGYSSGGWYNDQVETDWDSLGVQPELTTVTQRVRRVATFSKSQFVDAMMANDPDFVFLNFLNYLPEIHREAFIAENLLQFRDDSWRWWDLLTGESMFSDGVKFHG